MKITLLQDVKGIGKKGQTVEAKDGYARNFLIPKGLGVQAGSSQAKLINQNQAQKEAISQRRLADEVKQLQTLVGQTITISHNTNPKGAYYAPISSHELLVKLKLPTTLEKFVVVPTIGKPGIYKIQLAHPNLDGTFTVAAK